ncbi:unnamed protein product [Schistosoma margrebowiei]|uniref:Uncharacterized protein n=1 Tax=Schistosoma margrebowiei TaxID=48269 RepID=A0A183MWH2_9TREM|nr:unnamed protein product [Schistosoma margrebowiei]
MVVGGSQQETLDPGFVLFGTRQQGVPVILRELVLPGGFDLVSPSFTPGSALIHIVHLIKTINTIGFNGINHFVNVS